MTDRSARSQWLVVTIFALALAMCGWVASSSGFLLLFRSMPANDAAKLKGRVVALVGPDPFHPGKHIDLADLPAPVLVCRMELRSGHWVIGALKRVLAKAGRPVTLLAVCSASDREPPHWIASGGLPFRVVMADADTMSTWGFQTDRPEIRLIGSDGAVASVNLAGDDRDDTILLVTTAIAALPPAP